MQEHYQLHPQNAMTLRLSTNILYIDIDMVLLNWLLSALALMLVTYIVPGIEVANFITALLVALVLGLVNALIRPILVVLTLPITILSLGLFVLVINALLLMLVDRLIVGFTIDGFWTALFGSLVLTLIGWAANLVFKPKKAV